MKTLILFSALVLVLTACTPATPAVTVTPTATNQLTGAYIGQTPPAEDPLRFGSGFFCGQFHSAPVFAPEGDEVWWAGSYGSATIYYSHIVDGIWAKPETVKFSENIDSYRDPFISPDGSKFYFISASPLPGSTTSSKENIWMMERVEDGWSEPQPLPESINRLALHWTLSVADNYNLYFSAKEGEAFPDIYLSRYENGAYTDPVLLEAPVNSDQMEITPNIAPDESYMLFSHLVDNNATPFLHISYASDSGWTDPVKVENVPYCISPIVTPDRKYVIFLSSPSSFSWRDTSFIEEFRP
jgi:hypothetical protein